MCRRRRAAARAAARGAALRTGAEVVVAGAEALGHGVGRAHQQLLRGLHLLAPQGELGQQQVQAQRFLLVEAAPADAFERALRGVEVGELAPGFRCAEVVEVAPRALLVGSGEEGRSGLRELAVAVQRLGHARGFRHALAARCRTAPGQQQGEQAQGEPSGHRASLGREHP